jgi:hypothetical protein
MNVERRCAFDREIPVLTGSEINASVVGVTGLFVTTNATPM